MIKNAKVNLQAVKRFRQSVLAVKDYSPQFDKGIYCLDETMHLLLEQINTVQDCIGQMSSAQDRLAPKIRDIKAEIARLTATLNELEDQLASLKRELDDIPKTISMTDGEGKTISCPNPAYSAVVIQIETVNLEISKVNMELIPLQQRLGRANLIDGNLSSQIDSSRSIIYSLQEKQNSCRQYKAELEEIKNKSNRNSTSAADGLKRIEEIVAGYLRIKMTYENASLQAPNTVSPGGLNVSININKTIVHENEKIPEFEPQKITITKEEIEKHNIKFNKAGRITEYDGKSFGGQYNSYEIRLSYTSADDNPLQGYYVGERGESKFIPSGRTAEGIVVIEILKNLGLDGIEYRNAEPDFEVCSEAVVKIKTMTEHRDDYSDADGIPRLGNFSQADIECAKQWNKEKRGGRDDWSGRDVLEYRQANKLTWHEKCDTETMVMVRSEINLYFKHIGGVSECKKRDGVQDGGEFDE